MNNNATPLTRGDLIKRNQKYISKFMQNPLVLGTAIVMAISLFLLFLDIIMVSSVKNPESPYYEAKFTNTPYMSFLMVSSPLSQIAILASLLTLHLESKKNTSSQVLPLSTAVLIVSVAVCVIDTAISFSYKSLLNPTVEPGISALFNAFSKDTTVEEPLLKLSFLSVTDMFKNIGMISLFRTIAFLAFAIPLIVSQLTPYYANYGTLIYGLFSFIMIVPAFFFFILSFYPSYYPAIYPSKPLELTGEIPPTPDYIFIAQRLFTYIGYLLQAILGLKFFSNTLSAGWLGRKIKIETNEEN